jgi:hypothetical protein
MPALSVDRPLAIAMWDFTWLCQHHRGGAFADWAARLDELVERGYNAIRIDCFPHWVARDPAGGHSDAFRILKRGFGVTLWGNAFTVEVNPREALRRFLPMCRQRGIKVGLSTWWYYETEPARAEVFQGLDQFVRAWDETLAFLDHEGLLDDNILYADLLNEYPLYHGFDWLKKILATMDQPRLPGRLFNPAQVAFYNRFSADAVRRLQARWPRLPLTICQTINVPDDCPWQDLDQTGYGLIDRHLWFCIDEDFKQATGYWDTVHPLQDDLGYARTDAAITAWWSANRNAASARLEAEIARIAARGRQLGIPVGNTEGWGTIFWMEHPALSWDFTKEAGEVAAHLGAKHGFAFNCTSNYTHPHFTGIWNDVAWHRRVTAVIRGGA